MRAWLLGFLGLVDALLANIASGLATLGRLAVRVLLWPLNRLAALLPPSWTAALAALGTYLGPTKAWLYWGAVGLTLSAGLALREIGALLSASESSGELSFSGNVLTGFKLNPFDSSDVQSALSVWKQTPVAKSFLHWHLRLDLLLFIPGYCLLAWLMLKQVGTSTQIAARLVLSLLLVDICETATTYVVLGDMNAPGWQVMVVQLLTWLKWAIIATTIVVLVVNWLSPGASSASNLCSNVVVGWHGGGAGQTTHPGLTLIPLVILVGAFMAFLSLPGPSALEQVPDVLRYQAEDVRLLLWSLFAFALLGMACTIAGVVATDPGTEYPRSGFLPTRRVLAVAIVVSAALFAWAAIEDREIAGGWPHSLWGALPALSFLVVAAAVAILGKLASLNGLSGSPAAGAPQPVERTTQTVTWVSALAAVVWLAAGLGLVRAGLRPALIEGDIGNRWVLVTVAGFALAVAGGRLALGLTRVIVSWWESNALRRTMIAAAAMFTASLAAVGIGLSRWPDDAFRLGTPAVVALSLGGYAVGIAGLIWLSRRMPPWIATYGLRLGARTPWLALLLVTWFVAGAMNTTGGYHDVRVRSGEEWAHQPRHATINAAFEEWLAQDIASCAGTDGSIPLVMVAAPGGGMKAAYWTAAALHELFDQTPGNCAERAFFAFSGVSGGAVGATLWASVRATGSEFEPSLGGLADDHALANTVAGLLLRDAFQPLTAIRTGWRDRGALLEDGWTVSAHGAFGTPSEPLTWRALNGETDKWMPVMVLNGSSVTDGCRAFAANTGGLAFQQDGDCYSGVRNGANATTATRGLIPGGRDVLSGLYRAGDADVLCGSRGVRVTTAALTSARFPVVSPSGTYRQCLSASSANQEKVGDACDGARDSCRTSYLVDGGYYEGSGMLTAIELWSGIESAVREHNRNVTPTSEGVSGQCIEPWLLLIDPGYRSAATNGLPGRPGEVLLPLQTLLRRADTFSTTFLEQAAHQALAQVGCPASSQTESRVVRIGLTVEPEVAAPTGWVLSELSRQNMDSQLACQLGRARGDRDVEGCRCPEDTPGFKSLQVLASRLRLSAD